MEAVLGAEAEEPTTTLVVVDGFGSATPLLSFADLSSAERAARQANFLRAMEQVELADIPFPDESPRGYPDAARWAELLAESEARKARSTTSADER